VRTLAICYHVWCYTVYSIALLTSAGAWELIQAPVSARVRLEEDAIFSCRARATSVYYAINGSKYTPSDIRWTRNLTDDGFNMTLVIPGVKKYNNTRVRCCLNIRSQRDPICSEVAHLVIEGKLNYLSSTLTSINIMHKQYSSARIKVNREG